RLVARQAGLDDPGVVKDQQVAGPQQAGQVGKAQVVQGAGAVKVQQAAARPLRRGSLRDELGGQGVVEVGKGEGRGHAGRSGKARGAAGAAAQTAGYCSCAGWRGRRLPAGAPGFCMLAFSTQRQHGGHGMAAGVVRRAGPFGRWLAACALLGATLAAQAQGLPDELSRAWKASGLPSSALSVVVQELGGHRIVAVNAQEPRNPASVMKLVTTWAALSELGPNYVWRTEFLTEPGARPDAQGALPGPLYLRAGGDPYLLVQDLWALLRELRLRGVKKINDLVVDRSIFGQVAIDPGAFDGAPDRAYNASPDSCMVGFGPLRLLFTPDHVARKWVPIIDPPLPGLRIEGQVDWSEIRCPGPPVVTTEPILTQQGVSIRLGGTVAGSCGEFSLYRLALSQPEFAESLFRLLWRELGGTFTGRIRTGMVPGDAVALATHESRPLGEAIRQINKRSNNVMARTLLLTLGAERGRRPATTDSSEAVAKA